MSLFAGTNFGLFGAVDLALLLPRNALRATHLI